LSNQRRLVVLAQEDDRAVPRRCEALVDASGERFDTLVQLQGERLARSADGELCAHRHVLVEPATARGADEDRRAPGERAEEEQEG
jgi:hypothetical protein